MQQKTQIRCENSDVLRFALRVVRSEVGTFWGVVRGMVIQVVGVGVMVAGLLLMIVLANSLGFVVEALNDSACR